MAIKRIIFLLLVLFVFAHCEGKQKVERPIQKVQEERSLIVEAEDGRYTEWYPGHRQVKITGRKNKDGNRDGVWKYYSEGGVELSVSVYSNGLRDGHTVVKYPNGTLHYVGEYVNDEPVGVWEFYNEDGTLSETKDYSKK